MMGHHGFGGGHSHGGGAGWHDARASGSVSIEPRAKIPPESGDDFWNMVYRLPEALQHLPAAVIDDIIRSSTRQGDSSPSAHMAPTDTEINEAINKNTFWAVPPSKYGVKDPRPYFKYQVPETNMWRAAPLNPLPSEPSSYPYGIMGQVPKDL